MANRYAERARALVGTRFRAQGRDPTIGLDCAGLAIVTYGLSPGDYRRDYRLRGDHTGELRTALEHGFRRVGRRRCRPGDVLLLQVASDQIHLAVKSEAGFVHADATIGQVVETPGDPSWHLVAVYRRRARQTSV